MVCIIGLSCSKKKSIPEHIIPEERMAEILVDIHLLESKIDHLDIPRDSSQLLYKAYEYDLLVNKYKVDTLTYKQSFTFYTKNLTEFGTVYDIVLKSMEEKQKDGFWIVTQ